VSLAEWVAAKYALRDQIAVSDAKREVRLRPH
jgi:hypothetical protein